MKHDVGTLEKLLNTPHEKILEEALDCYVERGLPKDVKEVYLRFLEIANAHGANNNPTQNGSDERYKSAKSAAATRFNSAKTRGRIMLDLMSRTDFSRDEFRKVVAQAMKWDQASGAFGIQTKFRTLDEAERAWWHTLKGRDKLIIEVE